MADLVRRGDVHPRELVEAAIERAEARNPALNAIIHRQFERARADAEQVDTTAPFAGVPFLLKDYKGREAGEPYHMGVRTLRELDYRPRTDSGYALRVRCRRADPDRTHQHARAGGDGHRPSRRSTVRPTTHGISVVARAGLRVDRPPPWRRGSCRPPTPTTSLARSASRLAVRTGRAQADPRARDRQCRRPTDRDEHRGRRHPIGPRHGGAASICSRGARRGGRRRRCRARSPTRSAPDPGRCGSACGPMPSTALRSTPASAAAATRDGRHCSRRWDARRRVGAGGALERASCGRPRRQAMAIAAATEAAAWKERIGHALGEADLEPRTWGMVQAGQAISAPEAMALIERMQRLARSAFEWFERVRPADHPDDGGAGDRRSGTTSRIRVRSRQRVHAPDQRDRPAGDLAAARMAGRRAPARRAARCRRTAARTC